MTFRKTSKNLRRGESEFGIYPSTRLAIRDVLMEKYEGICQLCLELVDPNDYTMFVAKNGRHNRLIGPLYPTIEHIVPAVINQDWSMDNLTLAHKKCNDLEGRIFSEWIRNGSK